MMSAKFPLLVVLAELAAQLKYRGCALDLFWTPRDQNELAHALTNGDVGNFSPQYQIEVHPEKLPFILLPEYMRVAEDLYNGIQAEKAGKKEHQEAAKKQGPAKKLRATAPW